MSFGGPTAAAILSGELEHIRMGYRCRDNIRIVHPSTGAEYISKRALSSARNYGQRNEEEGYKKTAVATPLGFVDRQSPPSTSRISRWTWPPDVTCEVHPSRLLLTSSLEPASPNHRQAGHNRTDTRRARYSRS